METQEILPTAAELEFLRLERERKELQLQQDALKEQLVIDREKKVQQELLAARIKENNARNDRTILFFNELINNGVRDYVLLIKDKMVIKSSSWGSYIVSEEVDTMRIKISGHFLDHVGGNNKVTGSFITDSFREYTAKGLAKKILEKIEKDKKKKNDNDKLKDAENSLIKYFTQISPEGTVISSKKEYTSNRNSLYTSRRLSNSYCELNIITLEFPNKSWVEILYHKDESWSIVKKFDSKVAFNSKEEWINYLMT